MQSFYKISAALMVASALSACGGGSDDDAGSTTAYSANAAWGNLFASPRTWRLSGKGSSSGQDVSVQATLALSLLADGTFSGTNEAGKVRRLSTTLNVNNQGDQSGGDTTYYLNASNGLIGTVYSDGSCTVPSAVNVPPTSAMIGNSGLLATWVEYSSCNGGGFQTGSGTTNWSIEKANSHVYFCSTDQYTSTDKTLSSTQKQCFEVSSTGAIGVAAALSAVLTDNGVSTTITLTTP